MFEYSFNCPLLLIRGITVPAQHTLQHHPQLGPNRLFNGPVNGDVFSDGFNQSLSNEAQVFVAERSLDFKKWRWMRSDYSTFMGIVGCVMLLAETGTTTETPLELKLLNLAKVRFNNDTSTAVTCREMTFIRGSLLR